MFSKLTTFPAIPPRAKIASRTIRKPQTGLVPQLWAVKSLAPLRQELDQKSIIYIAIAALFAYPRADTRGYRSLFRFCLTVCETLFYLT